MPDYEKEMQARVDSLKRQGKLPTFGATLQALEKSLVQLDREGAMRSLRPAQAPPSSGSPEPSMRDR